MPSARFLPVAGGLALQSDYHGGLVAAIKALPYADRKWDNAHKLWIIAPQHADQVARWVEMHLGVAIEVPPVEAPSGIPEIRMVRLEYLGRCKDRGGEKMASGYTDGAWSLLFPEVVLRTWFADDSEPSQPEEAKTLYQVLGIRPSADQDGIKKAYRQMARQWHPDVCREPDAAEQFKRIQHAYELLRDDLTRRKYDVGLRLEEMAKAEQERLSERERRLYRNFGYDDYRAPLRCGLLLLEGQSRVGQFIVTTIHRWEDVTRNDGKVMVSSWPPGADTFQVDWV